MAFFLSRGRAALIWAAYAFAAPPKPNTLLVVSALRAFESAVHVMRGTDLGAVAHTRWVHWPLLGG